MSWEFRSDPSGALIPAAEAKSPLPRVPTRYTMLNSSQEWVGMVPAGVPLFAGAGTAALAGDLHGFPIVDFLGYLGQSTWTGVVEVRTDGHSRVLVLRNGEVRDAHSTVPSETLKSLLVRLGFASETLVERAAMEPSDVGLGWELVQRGHLAAHGLYACLKEMVAEVFHGMVTAPKGCFVVSNSPSVEQTVKYAISLSMQSLLMDNARRTDEMTAFRRRIPSSAAIVERVAHASGELEPQESALLQLVDGVKTVNELGRLQRISEHDATKIVFRLLEGGLVTVSTASAHTRVGPARGVNPLAALAVFNRVFLEIRNTVGLTANGDKFLAAANAALAAKAFSQSPLLEGLTFKASGTIDPRDVGAKFQRLIATGELGPNPRGPFERAMSDVMFFLLFQAGRVLDAKADEDLATRVKELLHELPPR